MAHFGDTPLHLAARCGNETEVRELLKSKQIAVDILNASKQTPLHLACIYGHLDIACTLVNDFNADMEATDISDNNPLLLAAINGHVIIVVMLLLTAMYGKRYHRNFRGPSSSSICKLEPSKAKVVEDMVLKYVRDSRTKFASGKMLLCKFRDKFWCTGNVNFFPLFLAAILGLKNAIETMVKEHTANIYMRGFDGLSVLHCASFGGHSDLVNTLISDYNLDHLSLSYSCYSALHYAAMGGNVKIISLLVTQFKIDPRISSGMESPLTLAAINGHEDVVEILTKDYSCSPYIRGSGGSTLLHSACRYGHIGLIDKFIS